MGRRGGPLLVGFTDSDWACELDDQNSTAGYVFSMGSGPVTWACKKQQALALSSAEAEYRAAVNASQMIKLQISSPSLLQKRSFLNFNLC